MRVMLIRFTVLAPLVTPATWLAFGAAGSDERSRTRNTFVQQRRDDPRRRAGRPRHRLFTRVSLAGELSQGDVMTVLDDFVMGVRDISLVWPRRRFYSGRVQRVTDFFAKAIPQRL
jgi:hypothetical protein